MLPEVKVAPACWRKICAELDRVFPCEGLLVPLVTLTPRREDHNPCQPLHLDEIGELVIAGAVLVPQAQQINAHARVSVRPQTDGPVNAEVTAALDAYPRLRACAYLHSHPFAVGSTWPSRGLRGDYEGHMLPLLERNRAAGLETCFSFIACRDSGGSGWALQGFALDAQRRIVDLGMARVMDDPVEVYREHLVPALEMRPLLHRIVERWRGEMQQRGLSFRCDELFDGWSRTIIELSPRRACVVLIPIRFPEQAARCFVVDREQGTTLPHPADTLMSLGPYACLALVEEVTERDDVDA